MISWGIGSAELIRPIFYLASDNGERAGNFDETRITQVFAMESDLGVAVKFTSNMTADLAHQPNATEFPAVNSGSIWRQFWESGVDTRQL